MKIAILTLHLQTNYGGILQAWALQNVLRKEGHDAGVIYKPYKPHWTRMWCKVPVQLYKKYIRHQNIPVFHEKVYYQTLCKTTSNTQKFIDKHIDLIKIDKLSKLKQHNINSLVIGSDQIWRPTYFCGSNLRIADAFGRFAEKWGIRRLSYAASFGLDSLKDFSTRDIVEIRNTILSFSGVSVREASGVELCRKHFGVEAEHVLDPTMLIDHSEYLSLIGDSTPARHGIMSYILDHFDGEKDFVDRLSAETRLPVFTTLERDFDKVQPPVEQWLAGFRDAQLVVTDSFHACVFSILFNKPFIVTLNATRGTARIASLLKMFGLEDRMVTDFSKLPAGEIDWSRVNARLTELRTKSMNYLRNALLTEDTIKRAATYSTDNKTNTPRIFSNHSYL